MKQIFISHSTRDLKILQDMRDHLIRAGFKPWLDPNPRPGMDWRFEIDDAIRMSDVMIVIVTPHAAQSVYVTYEWTLALENSVPVIPVVFRDTDIHPRLLTLETFSALDWRSQEQFWDYFMREMKRLMRSTNMLSARRAGMVAPPKNNPPPAQESSAPRTASLVDRSVMPSENGHWLVIRRGPELNRMFRLEQVIISVGRDDGNDIVIKDPEISRYHLRLRRQASQGYAIEDLGSTNGTLVEGLRIAGLQLLHPSNTIMLGDSVILSYEVV